MKKALALVLAALLLVSMAACTGTAPAATTAATTAAAAETTAAAETEATEASAETESGKTYTVGICNYADDASLNQIVENIRKRLAAIGTEKNVTFEIRYDNCNGDSNVL